MLLLTADVALSFNQQHVFHVKYYYLHKQCISDDACLFDKACIFLLKYVFLCEAYVLAKVPNLHNSNLCFNML